MADIREEAARETAERHGIPNIMIRENAEEENRILSRHVLPTPTTRSIPWLTFRAGCHVVCEKPVAMNCADAEEMFRAADQAGRHLFVIQSLRFTGNFKAAASLAQSGCLGEIYYARI